MSEVSRNPHVIGDLRRVPNDALDSGDDVGVGFAFIGVHVGLDDRHIWRLISSGERCD